MSFVVPSVTLRRGGIALVPLSLEHEAGLAAAGSADGLSKLKVTWVPDEDSAAEYIQMAIDMRNAGSRVAFAVIEESSGDVIGSTSYHDIVLPARRVEIGYTFYAKRFHRTHVNPVCKLMLLEHAFETLGASVVGWRTDGENYASQAAIEALGAQFDGRIRRHGARRNGDLRDSMMYSMTPEEWPAAKEKLYARLAAFAEDF
jgi:RimJ/RimL family protein N-acetyltransferase